MIKKKNFLSFINAHNLVLCFERFDCCLKVIHAFDQKSVLGLLFFLNEVVEDFNRYCITQSVLFVMLSENFENDLLHWLHFRWRSFNQTVNLIRFYFTLTCYFTIFLRSLHLCSMLSNRLDFFFSSFRLLFRALWHLLFVFDSFCCQLSFQLFLLNFYGFIFQKVFILIFTEKAKVE